MAQDYTANCYDPNNAVNTDMNSVEKNFNVLRTKFSGSSAPSSPVAGQWWADTSSNMLKIRSSGNSSWLDVYNYSNGEIYIASSIRKASLISGEAISPGSCTLKTPEHLGGNFPVNYAPVSTSGYYLSTGGDADIVGMSTQVYVQSSQRLNAKAVINIVGGTSPAGYIRFSIGSVYSNQVTTGSGENWTSTMTAVVSGSGWQTLKWRGYASGVPTTSRVLANTVSLG